MGTMTAGREGGSGTGGPGIPGIATTLSPPPVGMPSCWHMAAAGPNAQGHPQAMVAAGQEVTLIHAGR